MIEYHLNSETHEKTAKIVHIYRAPDNCWLKSVFYISLQHVSILLIANNIKVKIIMLYLQLFEMFLQLLTQILWLLVQDIDAESVAILFLPKINDEIIFGSL